MKNNQKSLFDKGLNEALIIILNDCWAVCRIRDIKHYQSGGLELLSPKNFEATLRRKVKTGYVQSDRAS